MSSASNPNLQEFCTVCHKVSCDIRRVNDDIMMLLLILTDNKTDISSLQNSSLCIACLDNIRSVCKFKMSLQSLRIEACASSVQVKEEFVNEKTFITCWSCKSSVKQTSAVPLQDYSHLGDVVQNLIPNQGIEEHDIPQICESCQKSLLKVYRMVTLIVNLSACKGNKTTTNGHQNIELLIKHEPPVSNTDDDVMIIEIKQEPNINEETLVKEEVEEEQGEVYVEKFQIKSEEVDLKIDSEEERSSEGIWERHSSDRSPRDQTQYICYLNRHITCKNNLEKPVLTHKGVNEIEIFSCDKCEYQTKYKRNLEHHCTFHKDISEIQMFSCDQCDYQTNYKQNLKHHSLVHKEMNETVIFSCTQCDYVSKYRNEVKRHLLIHELFKCDQCEYQTKCKWAFKKHSIVHKGIHETTMFGCDQCKFQTKYKGTLTRHMIVHKGVNETKAFRCDQCVYQAKYKGSLKRHMISHNVTETSCKKKL